MGSSLRAVSGGVVFAIVLLGALDLRPTRRIPQHAAADRHTSEYPLFLERVARHTAPGDTIAILVPMKDWAHGQSYAFYRATYFLAGRQVIPLTDAKDQWHPGRLRDARYLAVWRAAPPPGPYDQVWSAHDGVLLRRRR